MDGQKLLTVAEICLILQVSRSKAYAIMQSKEIPVVQIGKCVRVCFEDLEEYIRTHRVNISEEGQL
jgi:excisionase family DNA binding protein